MIDWAPATTTCGATRGNDTITGVPTHDTIQGNTNSFCKSIWRVPGVSNRRDLRDGKGDQIACGSGTDAVTADAVDVVSGDCETATEARLSHRRA